MLVDQMEASFLWRRTFSITVGKKARISLFTSFLQRLTQRVVILLNVQAEEMGRWEISPTFGTSIGMLLCVVDVEGFQGVKMQRFSVWRQ